MIIFLYGEDTYRSREKLNLLKKKFIREVDKNGDSLIEINGETASMEKFNESLGASSLFARKRMIIIENLLVNKNKIVRDQFYDYLKNKTAKKAKKKIIKPQNNDDNIIVIRDEVNADKFKNDKLFKLLASEKFAQEFKVLSNTEAANWIKNEAISRGVLLGQSAAMELTALLGSDLWRLSNELNKLIHYKNGQQKKLIKVKNEITIEIEDVKNLVSGKIDENIFALTDAISNKNKSQAIKLFDQELEAGASDTYLMHMIIRQFKILTQVRQGLDSGLTERKILNQLKLHPFV
ncbi:MAG: hypothetical protein U9R06_03000, partial [Patescibacteria group bacterium]|nr:hypothetical protein [Patescibacteria group bacterium]